MNQNLKNKAICLRQKGFTYTEIQNKINRKISKSTLSYWFRHVTLPPSYKDKIKLLNLNILNKARIASIESKKKQKIIFQNLLSTTNKPISGKINDTHTAKIALAMLCLGEASKYNPKTRNSFYLGSSNHQIITLFLKLLQKCFVFDSKKIRCTVQCRADQNASYLTEYWHNITKIPLSQFYKTRVDPRTAGKPTKNPDYKGVLRVDYFDSKIRFDLENLSSLIYNNLKRGPVVHR